MNLAIITPSRSRIEGLYRLFKSINGTISGENKIDLIVAIDTDDPFRNDYATLNIQMRDEAINNLRVTLTIDKRKPVSKIWNDLTKIRNIEGFPEWYICGNDDFVFNTVGWDKVLAEKIKSKKHPYYMFFFDDGIHGANHGAFPIVSRQWITTLGYYFPEKFIHNYPDTWVNDIALKAEVREFIPEIKGTHLHYSEGLSKFDTTYSEGMADNSNEKDKSVYQSTESERIKASNLIKSKIWSYLV